MDRPVGVTILAAVAVLLAFINAIAMLRFLGFLPNLGPLTSGFSTSGMLFCTVCSLTYGHGWLICSGR